MQRHVGNAPFHPRHAALFGNRAQEAGIEPGIEVIGIIERAHHAAWIGRGMGKAPGPRQVPGHGMLIKRRGFPLAARLQPVLVHRHHVEVAAIRAEGVEIARIFCAPANEFDPQLEAALGPRQELALVDAQGLVEHADRRNGRFAHADRADFLAFHQGDGAIARERLREHRSRHPPG